MTSRLYVKLIEPRRLETMHVYCPLSFSFKLFNLSVHLGFPCCLSSWASVITWTPLTQVRWGRGLPVERHFNRTELPTGLFMSLRFIFCGCKKLGGAEIKEYWYPWIGTTQRIIMACNGLWVLALTKYWTSKCGKLISSCSKLTHSKHYSLTTLEIVMDFIKIGKGLDMFREVQCPIYNTRISIMRSD